MKFYWVIVFLYGRSSKLLHIIKLHNAIPRNGNTLYVNGPLTMKINYSPARAHALVLHVGVWLARRHARMHGIHDDLPNKNQVSSADKKTHLGPRPN